MSTGTIRVRFGIRLGWPIQNAATFVLYMAPERFETLAQAVGVARAVISGIGRPEIASRIICEES